MLGAFETPVGMVQFRADRFEVKLVSDVRVGPATLHVEFWMRQRYEGDDWDRSTNLGTVIRDVATGRDVQLSRPDKPDKQLPDGVSEKAVRDAVAVVRDGWRAYVAGHPDLVAEMTRDAFRRQLRLYEGERAYLEQLVAAKELKIQALKDGIEAADPVAVAPAVWRELKRLS
jgi:hypothetical protein